MSYRKHYEDSYLDEDDEDFDGTTDEERLENLLNKNPRTQKDNDNLKKVATRLLDKATINGDKDLYYKALDALGEV